MAKLSRCFPTVVICTPGLVNVVDTFYLRFLIYLYSKEVKFFGRLGKPILRLCFFLKLFIQPEWSLAGNCSVSGYKNMPML